jgi:hypothetical protein
MPADARMRDSPHRKHSAGRGTHTGSFRKPEVIIGIDPDRETGMISDLERVKEVIVGT